MDLHPNQLHAISLCTGGGGLDLALELAVPAARVVAYCEREAFACATVVAAIENGLLADAPIFTDVTTFPGRRFRGCVDLVFGGIPCQPWSHAGERQGSDDERDLWAPARRILVQSGAWGILIENVEGMLTAKSGQTPGARRVIDDLRRLGFRVEGGLFTAEEIGAPHGRRRVFLLAVHDGRFRMAYPAGVGFRREGDRVEPPRAGAAATGRPLAHADGHGHRGHDGSGPGAGAAPGGAGPGREPQRLRPQPGGGGAHVADAGGAGLHEPERIAFHYPGRALAGAGAASELRGPLLAHAPGDGRGAGIEQHVGSEASGRPALATPSDREMADAQGPRLRPRLRLLPPADGERGQEPSDHGGPLADALGGGVGGRAGVPQRGAIERAPAGRPGRGTDRHPMEDAADGGGGLHAGQGQSGPRAPDPRWSGQRLSPLFPPSPSDLAAWADLLTRHPELEPALRLQPHGLASRLEHPRTWSDLARWARVDQLRMLGNGVVPLQGAYAIRALGHALARRSEAAAFLVRLMEEP